ncbi:MAG: lactonase family protein [Bacteroidia bacterium]|nr:lactonase family protein [Bacteroidia bacterium]
MRSFTCIFLCLITMITQAQVRKELMYVGTYSVRGSKGVYVLSFNRAKGTFTQLQVVPSLESPIFQAIHPNKKFLYSVNIGSAEAPDKGGSVSAYGIDPATGKLSGLNSRPSYGGEPCHISIEKNGHYAFVSNYQEGNLVSLQLFDDGLVGAAADAKKFSGNSINKQRQEQSHIHSAVISPDNKFLYVADLGTDKVYIFRINDDGTLVPGTVPQISVVAGAGPRHFTFHPNGKYAYLAEELTSTVAAFSVDKVTGGLTILQDSVVSLPEAFKDHNTSADIHTDPKGKFLYMSNRGHDAIAIFSINTDGTIMLIGHQPVLGKTPRNFFMDPRGEFLFVANQDTDNIVVFRINAKTGKLSPVGRPLKIPAPVCLQLISLP